MTIEMHEMSREAEDRLWDIVDSYFNYDEVFPGELANEEFEHQISEHIDKTTEAYQLGFKEGGNNGSKWQCPYIGNTEEWNDWLEGFADGIEMYIEWNNRAHGLPQDSEIKDIKPTKDF